ncbi:MAG: leucine-rich repeat protein [Pseudomonadota bacterium]|nr:leucine-rich repeat protein [Pseudomonadota bacterium]
MSITFITLPKHLTSIDKSAFWGCTSLTSISVPATFDLQL